MIRLDLADLVVIAGRALDLDEAAVLERFDVAAAEAALTEAVLAEAALIYTGARGGADPAGAAAAGVALIRALLVHRPFPRDQMRVAAASGLQFLSVNGWRAELEPPQTAAVVIEALASGRLSPHAATQWLAPRLSALPGSAAQPESVRVTERRPAANPPRTLRPARSATAHPGRRLISALVAVGLGSLAMLATACAGSSGTAPQPGPPHHLSTPR